MMLIEKSKNIEETIETLEKVIEKTKTFVVDLTPMKIIENSCAYFGSSYQGRFLGTKNLIGISQQTNSLLRNNEDILDLFDPIIEKIIRKCKKKIIL